MPSAMGRLLANDLFDRDGARPVEKNVLEREGGVIELNPSEKALQFYEQFYESRGDRFQMINVVVCCYAFEEREKGSEEREKGSESFLARSELGGGG